MKLFLFAFLIFFINLPSFSQEVQFDWNNDEETIRAIFDEALVNGESYDNLRVLCKTVGGRLSGSPEAEMAVKWGKQAMERMEFDTVFLQEVMVPRWKRGDEESAHIINNDGQKGTALRICALGGSVSTGEQALNAEVIEVRQFEDLEKLGKDKVAGKIVFYNRPMDPRHINTFHAYGGCVGQRSKGAVEAAQYGAAGVLVRSMTLIDDDHPHTGSMHYSDTVNKIPAAAISTNDANMLSELLKNKAVKVQLNLNCKTFPDVPSHNVIGELKGSEYPERIILVGGHLDSWDNGEGAHDDGAGCVQSMEVLRIFKTLKIKPRHTIRVVLFMNEENGNNGGKTYAAKTRAKGEQHFAALESDRGGFAPRGFSIDSDQATVEKIAKWREILEPYGLHFFEKGYAGVDISPLRDSKIVLIGLVPDSQRYFDYHHSPADVFESVNQRELELGGASMAALIYLLDKHGL